MKKYLIRGFQLIVLLNFLLQGNIHGQVYNLNNYLAMPSVVPSSPNAASIEKFGNIPVDYSTGVPSIGIPVWNIKCGPIDWPFSLSYHSAGIKVDEIASTVGLGWALTGPGVISRSVIGKPDEQWQHNPTYTSISTSNYDYLYAVSNGQNDGEPDIFSYNFNGRSGKFLVQQDGSIFMMPYSNLKITNNSFNSFTIVDENGSTYTFDQKETVNSDANGVISTYTSSWYLSKAQPLNKAQSIDFIYGNAGQSVQTFYNFSQSIGIRPVPPTGGCGAAVNAESFSAPTFGRTNTTTTTIQLTQVNFPNGYIALNYQNDRVDIAGSATYRLSDISIYQQPTARLIKKFTFQQSYFFYRPPGVTTDDPSQHRLKLDEVDEIAGDLSIAKPYKFGYNTISMVPRGSYGQDKWGFNNGHYENTSLLQAQTVNYTNGTTYNVGNANRTIDVNQMQACMLNSVTYPTGGKTVYTFEPHQYLTNYTSTTTTSFSNYADGTSTSSQSPPPTTFTFPSSGAFNARIKISLSSYNYPNVSNPPYVKLTDLTSNNVVYNLSNFTPNNAVQTDNGFFLTAGHNYKAEAFVFTSVQNTQVQANIIVQWDMSTGTTPTESGGGLRVKEIKNYSDPNTVAEDFTYEYPLATPLTPFSYIDQTYNDVVYRVGLPSCDGHTVCSYYQSGPCRVYHSASVYPVSTVAGSPLLYTTVTKYSKDVNGADNGKTIYNYDVIQDQELPFGGPSVFNAHLYSNDWKNGFLTSELNYKETAPSGSPPAYQLINKTEHEYQQFKQGTAYTLKVYPNYIHSGCEYQGAAYVTLDLNFFAFPIYTGSKKITKSTATTIDDNGNQVATITTNEYTGATNDFITKTTTTDSKAVDKIVTTMYPADFSVTGNVYSTMVQQNVVSPVIQQQSLSGTTVMSTAKKNYRDWNNDAKVLAPELIQTSILTNPLENRVQYFGYDITGNPLSIAKITDAVQSYIYDYHNSYPIASVKNAALSDIAYTSFEADGTGGWTIPSNTPNQSYYFTGKSSYDMSNGAISKSGLIIGHVYLVSYWARSGPYPFSGGSAPFIVGRTINGWTNYIHTITTISSTITIGGTTGQIDELRLYPLGSEMITYTYDPLIGQTSSADVNSEVTSYEYDGLNRLKNVKDYQGNIVKNFQYNYSNSCGVNCVVLPMQTMNGSNTIGYPVGVFNVNNQLLGNATTQAQFISLWNGNSLNQAKGVLSAGADLLHFNFTLALGQTTPPVITGLRFYQFDIAYTIIDAIRNINGAYVDFGDGNKMKLGTSLKDIAVTLAPNTTMNFFPLSDPYDAHDVPYFFHTYPDNSVKTITIYHNDSYNYELFGLDNLNNPSTSLTKVSNLRGTLPQYMTSIYSSGAQIASFTSVANITNWSSITSVTAWSGGNGDGVTPSMNLGYSQDFMVNNKGLENIATASGYYRTAYRDLNFKISRLKSDWSTYFTQLNRLIINDDHWNHEDLSNLKKLKVFGLSATTQDHLDDLSSPFIPLTSAVMDNVIIQIAAGAGSQGVVNGNIFFYSGGGVLTSASLSARNQLKAAGWTIYVNDALQ